MIIRKEDKTSIVVNARFLTQRVTGVQRFAIEISKRLKRMNPSLIFVSPDGILSKEIADQLDAQIIGPFHGHLWEQVTLQLYVKSKGATLISFCNTGPLFIKNQIITVHDMSFMRHPEWFSRRFSTVYTFLVPRVSKRAKKVLTVSQFSKNEIIDLVGVKESKVEVVYNGITPFRLNSAESKNSQYHELLNDDYILTVSSHHPRKNFKNLIEAFNLIQDKNIKLYVIGDFSKNFTSLETHDSTVENVVFLEKVQDIDLAYFYENAKLFVYPSIYEGFGIPIIEAISFNIKCVVSEIPVFRELFENYVDYFDPNSIESIKNNIEYALSHPQVENVLGEAKNKIFEKFSWDSSAKKILKLLNQKG